MFWLKKGQVDWLTEKAFLSDNAIAERLSNAICSAEILPSFPNCLDFK